MKESFAHCLSGPINLDEQERERPVDRLHALASAARDSHLSSLGVSFLALRTANRADEYARTISKLENCLMWTRGKKPSQLFRAKIARQAVMERIIEACPRCQGKGEVPDTPGLDGAQRMKPCPPVEGCGGYGKRRYTDEERIAAMEISREQYRLLERHISNAIGFLNQAESEAIRTARRLLRED